MASFHESMQEYRKQLERGAIQQAYRGLMAYVTDLKAHFKNNYPAYFVPGNIYNGYMDMTYFSIVPESLKQRNLKIALVFLHEAFRFEVWLAGINKDVQNQYWKIFKESGWEKYPVVAATKGADAIIEHVLVQEPDFSDLEALTRQIERGTSRFISDIEDFLVKN